MYMCVYSIYCYVSRHVLTPNGKNERKESARTYNMKAISVISVENRGFVAIQEKSNGKRERERGEIE